MLTYPSPGRGAWRLTGGLLPAKPGGAGRMGYYRLNDVGTERPVGSGWLTRSDTSHHAEAVTLGVIAIQKLIGATPDGWYGPVTSARAVLAQARSGVEADGIVGPATMRALLDDVVRDSASAVGVPVGILGGIAAHESLLDPAAVGANGMDHGVAQINLGVHHPQVTLANAMDPGYALHWTGEDLAMVHAQWEGKTTADPWDIAIAHHNSPLLAKRWAITGIAPVVPGRVFQIEEYVEKVKAAWS